MYSVQDIKYLVDHMLAAEIHICRLTRIQR